MNFKVGDRVICFWYDDAVKGTVTAVVDSGETLHILYDYETKGDKAARWDYRYVKILTPLDELL